MGANRHGQPPLKVKERFAASCCIYLHMCFLQFTVYQGLAIPVDGLLRIC
jgi:hypothetical protein